MLQKSSHESRDNGKVEKTSEEDLFLEVILADYGNIIDNQEPFSSNLEYMQMIEYLFLIKNIRELTVSKLYQSFTGTGTCTINTDDAMTKRKGVDFKDLVRRKKILDGLLKNAREAIDSRLPRNEQHPFVPRILKLCEHYHLSKSETNLIHLMAVVQGSTNPYVINTLIEEDYFKRILCFQRLADLSEADVEAFCDPERAHLKEGLVTSEEDHGIHFNLRCSSTCVKLLYGIPLPSDELLKVSQTALESIISAEQTGMSSSALPSSQQSLSRRSSHSSFNESTSPIAKKRKFGAFGDFGSRDDSRKFKDFNDLDDLNGDAEVDNVSEEGDASGVLNGFDFTEGVTQTDPALSSTLGPYSSDNQLEYLEDGFQVIAVLVRVNAARLKDDMRKEGARMNAWDMGGEVKGGRRELQAKFSLLEKRMEKRLEATRTLVESEGVDPSDSEVDFRASFSNSSGAENVTRSSMPRLEIIATRLHLDAFEKRLILLLIGKTVSPVVKALMDTLDQGSGRAVEDVPTVGQVLSILCQDFKTQIANRKYFYRSGRLLSHGIISLSKSRWHQGSGDLTDQRIVLDRRVLDWAVGLDSEINELVEGSDLYSPKVSLQQVVLPKGQLGTIVRQCRAYDEFRKYRKAMGLEDIMSYGNSLVILLCGKSGTGKTMTVNAIAHDLSKKVLLVDFGSLSGRREGAGDLDADLRGLFREAHMSNAVLFFDECEAVFRSRDRGGERLLNALLTEIERHEGIVFLATNRPHDLDEAMHRRITSLVQFSPPDYNMRLRIWESLLVKSTQPSPESVETNGSGSALTVRNATGSANRIAVSDDVDFSALAIKFELTGGFIKNALLSAMLIALDRRRNENSTRTSSSSSVALECTPVILTQPDLEEGCRLQMRGSLSVKHQDPKASSGRGISTLALSKSLVDCCQGIISMEQSRTIVHGAWGGIGGNPKSMKQNVHNPFIESSSSPVAASSLRNGLMLQGEVECWNDTRCSTVCAFAGPSGYGKRTLIRAIANDLKRSVQIVHISELLAGSGGGRKGGDLADTVDAVENLLQDARISDAVVGIDGFEHILEDNTSTSHGDSGMKIPLLLSRLLDIFTSFPGLIILICHIDNVQNLILHKEFASRIFSFVRFAVPSYEIRALLWRELTPPNAPMPADEKSIDYVELGRKFELGPRGIYNALSRACARVVTRMLKEKNEKELSASAATASGAATGESHVVQLCQKDLLAGGEAEIAKLRGGGNLDALSKMFS